jgi:murein DD-endopeptidase MepM/ murein hydrolase activator NlpD
MSLDLRLRSRRRWGWTHILLAGAILIVAGLIAWQHGWQPGQVLAQLGQNVTQRAPLSISSIRSSQSKQTDSTSAVVLASSKVVENPASEAYTADLYLDTEADDAIPWESVRGRATVETYVVQEGETVWSIAADFGLDIDTLRWSNPELERNPDLLAVGIELVILPVNGVYHTVVPGDTISSVAAQYGVADVDIINYPPNGLSPPYRIIVGDKLIVPYGRKDLTVPIPSLAIDSLLAWPVVGPITQGFQSSHLALDIGAPYGTPVHAVDDGTIVYADWAQTGYGYTVIIDHGEGLQTWYSHLKGALLQAGDPVTRGQPLGEVGSTGRSTGPHVHFEVRLNGDRVNPIDYLPNNP